MIPPATQRYLFDQFPDSFRLRASFDDGTTQTGRFDLTKQWANEDSEPDYPIVTLQLSPTGVLRQQEQPISDIISETPSSDDTVAYERLYGQRVYDDLIVNVATKGYHDPTETDSHERMHVLLTRLQQFVRFELPDLLRGGTTDRNVIPVQVPVTGISDATDVSGLVDNEYVTRYRFSVQLNYTLTFLKSVDEVAGLDVDVTVSPGEQTSHVEIRYE